MAVQAEIVVPVVGYNSVRTEHNTGHSRLPMQLHSAPEFCWDQR